MADSFCAKNIILMQNGMKLKKKCFVNSRLRWNDVMQLYISIFAAAVLLLALAFSIITHFMGLRRLADMFFAGLNSVR